MGNPSRAPANDLAEARALAAVDDDDDDDDDGTQADDPVSHLGDLGALSHELGDVDPFAADDEAELPPVLPPSFDVFRVKDEVVDRMRKAGNDPTVTRINVVPVIRGKRKSPVKRLHPDDVTYARLCAALPPGTYDVQARNEDNVYMGGKRIRIDRRDYDRLGELDELDDFGTAPRRSPPRGGYGDRLLYELALRSVRGGDSQGRSSELSSAIGDFAKLMSLQAHAAAAQMSAQLKALEVDSKRTRSESNGQLQMLRTVMDIVDRRTPKRSNGMGTKVEDVIGLLQLGMHFQKGMEGKADESDSDELRKWVFKLLDSIGPEVVGLVAMLLPKDKAELLTDLIEQHLRTQEARAAGTGEGPETYDTTAEEVDSKAE